jgi:hypothetical protein
MHNTPGGISCCDVLPGFPGYTHLLPLVWLESIVDHTVPSPRSRPGPLTSGLQASFCRDIDIRTQPYPEG